MKHDWEKIVRAYAEQDGKSFDDEMKWLSERDSLESAVGCLGALNGPYRPEWRPALDSFGRFLTARGYMVPALWCPVNEYAYDNASRVGEGMPVNVELNNSSVGIRMQDYLRLRLAGKTRTQANRILGINPGSFYSLLERWGIKDIQAESELLKRIKENPVILEEMSNVNSMAPSKPVETFENPSEYQRKVQLNLTLTEAIIRESIKILVDAAMPTETDRTCVDVIWSEFAIAKEHGEDIASELVKRLREVTG